MKKILLAVAIFISSFSYAADPAIKEKVQKNFASTFPSAENVSWFNNATGYEVAFVDKDVRCRMWYGENGEVQKVMRYYGADELSPFITGKLKDNYDGKKVFGVTEVSTEDGLIYTIILEDEKNWYHVNCDQSGNLSTSKKFVKA